MRALAVLVLIGALGAVGCGRTDVDPTARTVVFVCEHGSAKSVAAAALFNDAAVAADVPWRAVARGLDPDRRLAPAVVLGLAEDGLAPPSPRPTRFTEADRRAARVVFLGDGERDLGPNAETWPEIPAISVDYPAARDAIRSRIATLIAGLR